MKTLFVSIALAVLGLTAVAGYVLYEETGRIALLIDQANESIDVWGGVEYLPEPMVDHLVDRLNESGYAPVPIDPADPLLRRRVIVVSEGMNERTARYVVERLVYLNELDSSKPIELRLATGGGWLDSAFAIVDTMRGIRAPVNVTALGGCYSAGTVILAAATGERTATPNTLLSVHVNDYQPVDGELDIDSRELARFRGVYERYTEVPTDWFDEPGDNQYYLDAREALELKLIDRIETPRRNAPEVPAAARPAA